MSVAWWCHGDNRGKIVIGPRVLLRQLMVALHIVVCPVVCLSVVGPCFAESQMSVAWLHPCKDADRAVVFRDSAEPP